MKILFLFTAFLLFAFPAYAQTIKTDEGQRLAAIEEKIQEVEAKIKEEQKYLDALLVKFSDDYPAVKNQKTKIAGLEAKLLPLLLERKNLQNQKLIKELPNNDIQLLKLIVSQNERIIELLQELLKKNTL